MSREADACVNNGLAWYEAILRTHGISGEIADGMWTCRGKVPPYYSNAITLTTAGDARRFETLRALRAAIRGPFSVKDSYADLDLSPIGMRPLFDADWIRLDPAGGPPRSGRSGAEWRMVTDARDLDMWEAAWKDHGSPAETRVFLPALLAVTEVALFAAFRGERVVAGCAANRSAEVVGFSNFFAAESEKDSLIAAAVAETMRFAPGLPVVGYERGEDLTRVMRLGFRTVGPLRVWIAED